MTGPAPQSSTSEESGPEKKNTDQTHLDAMGKSSRGSCKRLRVDEEEEDVLSLLDESEALN